MEEENNNKTPKTPILIRISSLIIMVMGFVGLLFFVLVWIYQLYNPEFLHSFSIDGDQYLNLSSYIVILLILHVGLIISSLLINNLKKTGVYIYIFVFLAMIFTEYYFDNNLILNYLIFGLLVLFIIILFFRRFK